MNGIILLASERSGTNLLRLMLGRHPRISAPPPAGHILRVLGPLQHLYFDGKGNPLMKEMIEDAVSLTRFHVDPWDLDLDAGQILNRLRAPSLWEVFRVFYELYAEKEGCDHWFSKDTHQFEYAYPLHLSLPGARFIYLSRDGRDVASSALRTNGHEQHLYFAAKNWKEEQGQCLRFFNDPKLKNKDVIHIRYENLISEPEKTLKKIVEFLRLPFDPLMLSHHESQVSSRSSKLTEDWTNLSRPVLKDNSGKYKTFLTRKEIRFFERLAGRELELLGYPREFPGEPSGFSPGPIERFWYTAVDTLKKKWKLRNLYRREGIRLEREKLIEDIRRRRRDN